MRDKTNGNIWNIKFIYGKNSKKIKGNLNLIKKILGIYEKLVLLILIIYFVSNQK